MRKRGEWLIEECKQHLIDVMGTLEECQPGSRGGRNSDIERAAGFAIDLPDQKGWLAWTLLNDLAEEGEVEVVREGRIRRYRLLADG